jgi:endonuclease/exonuclease/phosphatase family metal-dependent hydrolase
MLRRRASHSCARVFSVAAVCVLALSASVLPAVAQTSVALDAPKSEVVYATIRGGSYANTNFPRLLATRASDTTEYRRRALLKFDTHHKIPAGKAVTSALLTVTVKSGSDDSSRIIGAYQVTTSWTETQVTWNQRRNGQHWITAGGDLGSKLDQETVSNRPGTKVTFDVTALVKHAVAGSLGSSRYTRIALMDLEGSTSESYREYYTPDDPNPSVRPLLKVTYGSGGSTLAASRVSQPAPAASGSSNSTLRVLHWNTHHGGVGTDGQLNTARLIKKAASFRPDIVSFNEVERYTSHGNVDGPAVMAALMRQYTGQKWYYKFSTGGGGTTGNGNLVMSRFPIESTAVRMLSYDRSAVDVVIHAHGRAIHFTSTHLDAESTSYRLTQIGELLSWESTLPEPRVIAGDFNAGPGSSENVKMKGSYYDSWAEAVGDNTDLAYSGNAAGNTRNGRIDYIYYSRGASVLQLRSSQVYDVRDSNGVMPSDHRPVMAVFSIR